MRSAKLSVSQRPLRGFLLNCAMLAWFALTVLGASFARADQTTIDGVTWTYYVSNGNVCITKATFSGNRGVEIPKELGGYPVTSIDSSAFWCCRNLTSVTIPDGVVSIGSMAFYHCSELTSVRIPSSVTSVGDSAFEPDGDCKIKDITVPGWSCGIDLTSVTNVVISQGTVKIEDTAFYHCGNLVNVVIPDSVRTIGWAAFCCAGLESLLLPEGVTSVGAEAFWGCKITRLVLPASLKTIGQDAFAWCGGVKDAVVPGWSCGINFGILTNVTVLAGTTSVADGLFSDATYLERVIIPEGVSSIGQNAFSNCTSLTSVVLPSSLTAIGQNAFMSCNLLGEGVVIANGCVLTVNGDCPETVVLPEGTRVIAGGAFSGCKELTSVTMPEGVKYIGDRAFESCTALVKMNIPQSVDYIGDAAFSKCGKLGDEIVIVDDCVIALNGTYPSDIVFPEGTRLVGNSIFSRCYKLFSVTLPSTVESIGGNAFSHCTALTNVAIESGVKSIGDKAFYLCFQLPNIDIPGSVTNIGESAFWGCYKLPVNVLHSGLERIGEEAFMACSSVKYLVVPGTLTDISSFSLPNTEMIIAGAGFDPQVLPSRLRSYVKKFEVTASPAHRTIFDSRLSIELSADQWVTNREVRYTIDGSDPTMESTLYTKKFSIRGKTTVKAAVFLESERVSSVLVSQYGAGAVEDPVITSDSDIFYMPGHQVTLSCKTEGISIHYTLDGTDPSMDSPVYEGKPIVIDETTVVKAIALGHSSYVDSEVIERRFERQYYTVSAPQISSSEGESFSSKDRTIISISSLTDGSDIYYTLDGTDPKKYGIKYVAPFDVQIGPGANVVINAVAKRTDWADSQVMQMTVSRIWTLGDGAGWVGQNFVTGGASGWTSGSSLNELRSGVISDDQRSYIQTIISNPGMISFEWKCLCEDDEFDEYYYDHGEFSVDGVVVAQCDGAEDWSKVSHIISTGGDHILTWSFCKDASGSVDGEGLWMRKASFVLADDVVTVRFDSNGGVVDVDDRLVEKGGVIGLLESPTREHYVFAGWYSERVAGIEYHADSRVERGMTLYAHWNWTPQDTIVDASITGGKPLNIKADWATKELNQRFGTGRSQAFCEKFGGDFATALTKKTGKRDGANNELSVWHDYVAGTDPTDSNSVFKATMQMVNGFPVVEWDPNLNSNGEERVYTVYGKKALSDSWHSPTNANDHFFKVDVAMPPEGTIMFDLGDATGSVEPVIVRVGQAIGGLPTPSWDGYEFLGWFTLAEGGVPVNSDTIVTADLTIYAHWKSLITGKSKTIDGYLSGSSTLLLVDVKISNITNMTALVGGAHVNDRVPLSASTYHIVRTAQSIDVQFQVLDGSYVKCVGVTLSQVGNDIYGKVSYSGRYKSGASNLGYDFTQGGYSTWNNGDIAISESSSGYGVKNLTLEYWQ